MKNFFNVSNHPSSKWSQEQLAAALELGSEIVDISFPPVPATATPEEVEAMAKGIVETIPMESVVMCQGEFSLTFGIVAKLKARGTTCVVACSDRCAVETLLPDGTSQKTMVFKFQQFRTV